MNSPTYKLNDRAIKLVEQIRTAFADVTRDGSVTWHEAEGLDCHLTGDQLQAERDLDLDVRWQDVPADLFEELPIAVIFLDTKGLRYYLPAFMVADLLCDNNWNRGLGLLSDFQSALAHRHDLPDLLDGPQRRAVRDWLQFDWERRPWYESEELKVWKQLAL